MKNLAIIGLGSNIDPELNIKKALEKLNQQFTVIKKSEFVFTDPIGYTEQDPFLNGSIYIETPHTLEEVTSQLKSIEKELGRVRSPIKCGPRTLDLDIVVWNREIIDADFYERDFLKNAALELIPDLLTHKEKA